MPKPTQAEGGGGWVYTGPDVSRDSESIPDMFLMSCKADEHPEKGRERVGGSDRQNLKKGGCRMTLWLLTQGTR